MVDAASRKGEVLKNRPPKASEVKACSKWLDGELTVMQPSVILLYGRARREGADPSQFSYYRGNAVSGLRILRMLPSRWQRLTLRISYGRRVRILRALRQVLIDDIAEAVRKLQEAVEVPKLTLF